MPVPAPQQTGVFSINKQMMCYFTLFGVLILLVGIVLRGSGVAANHGAVSAIGGLLARLAGAFVAFGFFLYAFGAQEEAPVKLGYILGASILAYGAVSIAL